jgi:hypothetical protein
MEDQERDMRIIYKYIIFETVKGYVWLVYSYFKELSERKVAPVPKNQDQRDAWNRLYQCSTTSFFFTPNTP